VIGTIDCSSALLFKPVPYYTAIKSRFTAEAQRTPRDFLVITSLRPRLLCGEGSILDKNGSLTRVPTHSLKISLCFFDGRPEAEIHRPEDDQASSDMKGIENSF
jgi:hypothetical protein